VVVVGLRAGSVVVGVAVTGLAGAEEAHTVAAQALSTRHLPLALAKAGFGACSISVRRREHRAQCLLAACTFSCFFLFFFFNCH
jgi:hypothetical protein